jgi:hypothetical protein
MLLVIDSVSLVLINALVMYVVISILHQPFTFSIYFCIIMLISDNPNFKPFR